LQIGVSHVDSDNCKAPTVSSFSIMLQYVFSLDLVCFRGVPKIVIKASRWIPLMRNQTITRCVLVMGQCPPKKYVHTRRGLEPAIPVPSLMFQFTGAVLDNPERGRCCDFSGWREGTGTASSFACVVVLITLNLVILRFFSLVFQTPGEGQISCIPFPTGAHGREIMDVTIRQTVRAQHFIIVIQNLHVSAARDSHHEALCFRNIGEFV
jgi:hypothetical protein